MDRYAHCAVLASDTAGSLYKGRACGNNGATTDNGSYISRYIALGNMMFVGKQSLKTAIERE